MHSIKTSRGFTIVELLIVVVVIAILAAITIVSYNGISNQAHDTTVKSDLASMRKTLELWKVDKGGYPDPSVAATNILQDVKLRVSKGSYAVSPKTVNNVVYCYNHPNRTSAYAIISLSKSGKAYFISSKESGVADFTHSWGSGEGGDGTMCAALGAEFTNAYRGYASNDTTNDGPWRAWVNGS